ncbi:TetR/AcrR family transcriptional regulator C-terminal domain-containing protein [Levilactobacillus cerevisiae]|uniref:TetR/AcrR family transcriptional regulator C-terminal domain-containing protein n=1 Tax=Levilactobacillus cerevisiae TaxID=1704076 RepID=UPI000F7B2A9C|nr:TetR/AcrR family transcriptional regulator C-terminal domain-containing protein [Levilactobacillus cerevisiae]
MDVRRQLFNTVYTLVTRQEINTITVNDILADSGISRGTFYKYFTDKYDLINSYYEDAMRTVSKSCREYTWLGITTTPVVYMAAHPAFFRSAFADTGQNSFTNFLYGFLPGDYARVIFQHTDRQQISLAEKKAILFYVDGAVNYTRRWVLTGMAQSATDLSFDLHSFMPTIISKIPLNSPVLKA